MTTPLRSLDARSFRLPDRRQLLLGGALTAAAGAAAWLRPRRTTVLPPDGALEKSVPLQLGDYRYASSTGLILPDSDQTSGVYDQVLTRVYVAPDAAPIMLLIAYGSAQDAGLAVHRPEACYPSAGYTIGTQSTVNLRGMRGRKATALSASRGDRIEQIYFWMRIGERFPTSPIDEKAAVFAANLRGVMPDGVLVRLSVRSTDASGALDQMMAFNAMLLGIDDRMGRTVLLGQDRAS
ncbi:EpsI family protein [Sphingomonas sp. H160509]|uniref:exosortase C-terminal domain/associated protein EpsI n=1 Tax=Sphingomonas sp. H160509 TaxID=2955313 RepID=UPI002097CF7F|nr:exosortase C-terminal domain/associated protein EpsI [Sphingomonas sp. H160509]MDD1453123.1 EpsI family protein [Sphingomonas sp. H160509]